MAAINSEFSQQANTRVVPIVRPTPRWLTEATIAALIAAVVVLALLAWGAGGNFPGDSSVEAGFARDMSLHHAQAVEMAMLIADRTDDPMVIGLADDILLTQQNQMGQMLGWLDVWDLPSAGSRPSMAWMGHPVDGLMPGMATQEELNGLASLAGVEADREFLRLMILHHEGGVPMAQAVIERSDNPVVSQLAQGIIQSQAAEVLTMQAMLDAKGGGAPPSNGGAVDAEATPTHHP